MTDSMDRRLLLATLAVLPLAACGKFKQLPTYRYRLTVAIDTPEGVRTGSSVIEVRTSLGVSAADPAGSQLFGKVTGQAVAVDLPDHKTLFALLTQPERPAGTGAEDYAFAALMPPTKNYAQALAEIRTKRNAAELPPDAYPILVWFRDINDPGSVEKVTPDDLAATFGPGYAVHNITAQITDDPVTKGIENRLAVFKDSSRLALVPYNGVLLNPSFSQRIGRSDFQQGIIE
jgi:hypothetical protein